MMIAAFRYAAAILWLLDVSATPLLLDARASADARRATPPLSLMPLSFRYTPMMLYARLC